MSLLLIALHGSSEGLLIDMGQGNVHIPFQISHQEPDFRFQTWGSEQNSIFRKRKSTTVGGNKILKQFSPSKRTTGINKKDLRSSTETVYIGSGLAFRRLGSVCSPLKMLLLCSWRIMLWHIRDRIVTQHCAFEYRLDSYSINQILPIVKVAGTSDQYL